MIIKIGKKELSSLIGSELPLKTFVALDWAQDGMKLSTSRTLFLGSLKVKITWPNELAKANANRDNVEKAIRYLLSQVDSRAAEALKAQAAAKATEEPAPANA